MADAALTPEEGRDGGALRETGRGASSFENLRTAPFENRRTASLAEVLDRLLECGLALEGNLTLGLAGIDLVYLDLRALLAAIDTVWPEGRPRVALGPTLRATPSLAAPPSDAPLSFRPALCAPADGEEPPLAAATAAPPETRKEGGLARLVLSLAQLLHEVLERQALRRMRAGRLSATEIEAIGAALLAQAHEIERLRREFAPAKAGGAPLFELRLSDPSL